MKGDSVKGNKRGEEGRVEEVCVGVEVVCFSVCVYVVFYFHVGGEVRYCLCVCNIAWHCENLCVLVRELYDISVTISRLSIKTAITIEVGSQN